MEKMLRLFFNSSLMYSDGFARSFSKLDQEAHEIIIDFEIIQKKWALENGIKYNDQNWIFEIMMEQIKKIHPDIIYIQSLLFTIPGIFVKNKPDANLIEIIKQEHNFIKKILLYYLY